MLVYRSGSSETEINLSGPSIKGRIKTSGLYDYDWETEVIERNLGVIISNFGKKAKEYTLELDFCGTKEERAGNVNDFFEVTERDLIERNPGRLILNDYYIGCYVIGSEAAQLKNQSRKVQKKLKVYAPYPFWIKEHPYSFKASEITSSNNKRYAGKYAYRYANGLTNASIVNDHYAECNFRLIIYGPCTNPDIYIGGYNYLFNIVLAEGEYLEVDSAEETVIKYMVSGVQVNAFNNRNFVDSVFRPIQPGRQEVNWNGRFDFDLILFEERSEPKWS